MSVGVEAASVHLCLADSFVDRAQLEQIEGEGFAGVGRGDERRDAPDLARVTRLGELQQALEGVAALCGSFALAPHRALHAAVDVERGPPTSSSPYGSSTWRIFFRQRPIYGLFPGTMIRILIMY